MIITKFLNLFSSPTQDLNYKSGTLLERNQEIIKSFYEKIVYKSWQNYYVDNLVRDCLNVIAEKEGDKRSAPGYRYLSSWKSSALPEYRELADYIHQIYSKRYRERKDEQNQKEEAQIEEIGRNLYDKNINLITKFFEIAYRKVTTVDQYGDENWKAFDKELVIVICKIAENEGCNSDIIKGIKKGYFWYFKGSEHLKKRIEQEFRAFYDKEKVAPATTYKLEKQSGIEFENYLMNLFRQSGYDVCGTPSTGDQGADMIVTRYGRKIAIQAKRYSSNVGNKAIQEVVSARTFYACDEAWVITNAQFTKSAMELAQKCEVKLIDGYALGNDGQRLFK